VVYGDIERVVVLVEGLTRVMQHQPAEVLTDPAVNLSLRQLFHITRRQLDEDARDGGPSSGRARVSDGRTS
jgi:hypothetical protein